MEKQFFSKYNPFFRKNLTESLLGNVLTDIIITKSFDYQDKGIDSTLSTSHSLVLQFNHNRLVYLGTGDYNQIELREEKSKTHICHIYKDTQNVVCGFGMSQKSKKAEINLKSNNIPEFNKFFDKTLISIQLIKENNLFRQKIRGRFCNKLGVRGIRLIFKNQTNFNIFHYANTFFISEKMDLPFYKTIIEEDKMFEFDTEYYELGNKIIDINGINYKHPNKKLADIFLIDKVDIIEETELYVENLHSSLPNDIAIQHIKKKYLNHLPNVLIYLESLKKDMKINEYSLADIKFGFNQQMIFGVVKPIDIIMYNESNIEFIDNIIKQFKR